MKSLFPLTVERAQWLSDPAMLTQGSQRVCYCDDSEWRVSTPKKSTHLLMTVVVLNGYSSTTTNERISFQLQMNKDREAT